MGLKRRNYFMGVLQILMLLASIVVLQPFYFALMTSIKSLGEAAMLNFSLPSGIHLENYLKVFEEGSVFTGLKNSIILTPLTITIQIAEGIIV